MSLLVLFLPQNLTPTSRYMSPITFVIVIIYFNEMVKKYSAVTPRAKNVFVPPRTLNRPPASPTP